MATNPERVASPVAHYSSLLDEIVGCGDMVLLDPITIETVLRNLKLRYQAKEIYVSTFQCVLMRLDLCMGLSHDLSILPDIYWKGGGLCKPIPKALYLYT